MCVLRPFKEPLITITGGLLVSPIIPPVADCTVRDDLVSEGAPPPVSEHVHHQIALEQRLLRWVVLPEARFCWRPVQVGHKHTTGRRITYMSKMLKPQVTVPKD